MSEEIKTDTSQQKNELTDEQQKRIDSFLQKPETVQEKPLDLQEQKTKKRGRPFGSKNEKSRQTLSGELNVNIKEIEETLKVITRGLIQMLNKVTPYPKEVLEDEVNALNKGIALVGDKYIPTIMENYMPELILGSALVSFAIPRFIPEKKEESIQEESTKEVIN